MKRTGKDILLLGVDPIPLPREAASEFLVTTALAVDPKTPRRSSVQWAAIGAGRRHEVERGR